MAWSFAEQERRDPGHVQISTTWSPQLFEEGRYSGEKEPNVHLHIPYVMNFTYCHVCDH